MGWFLTYPRLDIQPDELLAKLRLCSATPIVEYVVCRELHKDDCNHMLMLSSSMSEKSSGVPGSGTSTATTEITSKPSLDGR